MQPPELLLTPVEAPFHRAFDVNLIGLHALIQLTLAPLFYFPGLLVDSWVLTVLQTAVPHRGGSRFLTLALNLGFVRIEVPCEHDTNV